MKLSFFLGNEIPYDQLSGEIAASKPRRVAMAQASLGYFIGHNDLFSTWGKEPLGTQTVMYH
ncbi:hypothetical protein JCM18909_379 [Cutibacterium acnes JCM 18909]|nr:hypothetical protein JCM18909_379 [Cutibacterium acnes JCM 18909]